MKKPHRDLVCIPPTVLLSPCSGNTTEVKTVKTRLKLPDLLTNIIIRLDQEKAVTYIP